MMNDDSMMIQWWFNDDSMMIKWFTCFVISRIISLYIRNALCLVERDKLHMCVFARAWRVARSATCSPERDVFARAWRVRQSMARLLECNTFNGAWRVRRSTTRSPERDAFAGARRVHWSVQVGPPYTTGELTAGQSSGLPRMRAAAAGVPNQSKSRRCRRGVRGLPGGATRSLQHVGRKTVSECDTIACSGRRHVDRGGGGYVIRRKLLHNLYMNYKHR